MKLVKGKKDFRKKTKDDRLNKCVKHFVLSIVFCLSSIISLQAQTFPPQSSPPRLVNDFANVLSSSEKASLEQKLVAYDDSTSTQVAIVIIESLEGAEVGSYAAELGEKWGVGSKKNHNGVMILMAKKEHKVTIRTGYGVEEKLGSIICDRIIKNKLVPNFKAGNFYEGFDEATDETIARLSGMYVNDEPDKNGKQIPIWVILLFIFIIFFILPMIFRGGGGKGGTTYSRGGLNTWGSAGGFLGGGGFGGGSSSSGGGFGGFGGGGFSGGGSSGSW